MKMHSTWCHSVSALHGKENYNTNYSRLWQCDSYQVSGSGQHEQGQTEVEVLLDDQVTQEGSQHNPTHTQKVGDCPGVLILPNNRDALLHTSTGRDKMSQIQQQCYKVLRYIYICAKM